MAFAWQWDTIAIDLDIMYGSTLSIDFAAIIIARVKVTKGDPPGNP